LYVHPSLTRGLFQDLTPAPPARLEVEALTPRELDVLRLLALGHTNRQIAQVLSLSVRTVESHRSSIVDKLGLRTRAELAQYAAEHHLWRPGK
jgi:two-component system response regulator NreC